MLGKNIGIDLGTSSVLIYVRGKGIVLREPAVVAMDKTTGQILKIGYEAQEMLGRTPKNIIAVHPIREGVISDYEMTEKMIKHFIKKVLGFRTKPELSICCKADSRERCKRNLAAVALREPVITDSLNQLGFK